MCGIAGIYNFKTLAPVDPEIVRDMTNIIAHRGPDADGFHFDGPVGLGHRRLAILDLSERGRQPMYFRDRRYAIVFNGEIYNYIELRKELIAKGCVFHTDTDTEVLLALFAEYGVDCLKRLNGMFSFAIWDSVDRSLFLARDRVGIKPLYYSITSEGISFASEIKSLFVSKETTPTVDLPLIDTYFSFGYVPGTQTLFEGVHKLAPGHWMWVRPTGLTSRSYWDVHYAPNLTRTATQTAEELRDLLLDAAKIHMRSDVPVGVFLSGGVDSSTTVALLAEEGFENLKTFCVAYGHGSDYDETKYARLVADRFRTDHHVLYVTADEFKDFIPRYVWHMDEPVTEAAAISLYFISKLLREHVTVALSGEGSDELFGGYGVYRRQQNFEAYRKLPAVIRQGILEPLCRLSGNRKLREYARLASLPLEKRYFGVPYNDSRYKQFLYADDFWAAVGANDDPLATYYDQTRDNDALSRMLYNDLKTWLVDDLLIKADKMTMANSVELRVPFLDYRVVEYAASIPSRMKIRRGEGKWILKQAMKNRLPDEILTRTKMGFPTPLRLMFQEDLSSYVYDLLLAERSINRAYFKREAIESLIAEHMSKKADHHIVLWKLIVLEEWHKQFVDARNSRVHAFA